MVLAWKQPARGRVKTFLPYLLIAPAEILGCFSGLLRLRHGKPVGWVAVSVVSLGLLAWLLTLHPTDNAGRV